jgi:hypothetical protein
MSSKNLWPLLTEKHLKDFERTPFDPSKHIHRKQWRVNKPKPQPDSLTCSRLNAIQKHLIEFGAAVMAHGRVANPTYDPSVKKGVHKIGEGTAKIIPTSQIKSPQATVLGKRENARARNGYGSAPIVKRVGKSYVALDGNHRIAASIKRGARSIKAIVQ